MKTSISIVQSGKDKGLYDMWCKWAIIDHPKHGRLYITQFFCGEGIYGEMYRWGRACQLKADDTIETLTAPYNDQNTILAAMLDSRIDNRPIKEWRRATVEIIATKLRL